jgi:PAS domain S-box-containing protein
MGNMTDWGLKTRLGALLAALLVLLALSGGVALHRLRSATAALETLVEDRVVPLRQLRTIAEAYGVQVVGAVHRARDGRATPAEAIQVIDSARAAVARQWRDYKLTRLVDAERSLIGEAEPLLQRADAAVLGMRGLLAAADLPGLRDYVRTDMHAALDPAGQVIGRLMDVQLDVARELAGGSRRAHERAVQVIGGLSALALLLGLGLAWAVLSRYRTEQQESERHTRRLHRFYIALSRTNQLIVRECDAQKLFDEICRICVETGHAWATCAFLIEGTQLVRVADAGGAAQLFAGLPARWDLLTPEVRGSVIGQAVSEGVPASSQGYLNDPRSAVWHQRAQEVGLRSVAAFPLRRGGQVVGALALYATEEAFFDAPLLNLLEEMSGDLSFALDHIDREHARLRALQEAEAGFERFRRVFHASPIATVITSMRDFRIVDINDTCCRRYGMTRSEFVGSSMRALGIGLVEEDREGFYAEMRQNQCVRNRVVRVTGRDGIVRRELINAEPIDYLGEPCHVAMALDVTELHRAEAAQEEAEAANRAKTDFLSRMSHELRTPLNAVLGFSQLLCEDAPAELGSARVAQLEHIHRAGQHLRALIDDVLDVSRIEAGRLQIQPRPVSLHALLDEALGLTEPLAERHAVTLVASYRNAHTDWAQADPIRLRQVLLNLLSNAVKYNRAGGSVTVTARSEGAMALIDIIDTGLGMTGEQLAHLYEPFNRLGREAGGIEGTGIGLALSRQLVRLMLGQIVVDSEAGRGTRVRLALPRGAAQDQSTASLSPQLEGENGEAPAGLVLYIEDNPVNLLLVEQLLSRWPGVRMAQAEDGTSGIDMARTLRPDLVLLDMHLPDIDGLAVLRSLRGDPATHDLVIISLSASAMPEEMAAARAAGATDYWTKPLDFARVLAGLRELLPRPRH